MLKYIKGKHRHHIVPRHAGGTDDDSNMVYLTKEEHIAAHQKRYEELGDDADRRAVLLLRHTVSDVAELAMWRRENAKKIALLAHEAKLKNGFYQRLGKLNQERLKGKPSNTAEVMQAAVRGTKWFTNGIENKRLLECPAGWTEGRLYQPTEEMKERSRRKMSATRWWTDEKINKRSEHQPSPEFILGRSKGRKHAEV